MSWRKLRPFKSRFGRVFIIPTKFGATFTAGAVLMLLIGSAYENNLVNLLGFFMLAILFSAMFATHGNIHGLEIARVETVHGFAGELFPVSLIVHNPSRAAKSNCDFSIRGFKKDAQYDARSIIPSRGEARLLASFESPARGVHALKKIVLSTTAPFGLFYAWRILETGAVATIYPRRRGGLSWVEDTGGEIGSLNRASGAEDYKGHRAYQTGDNLRRVDWKAYARGRTLMTTEYDEASGHGLLFNFESLGSLDHEQRLEQLAKWIDLAIQRGRPFTLTLPTKRIGPDQGLAFAHRAWSELARLENESGERVVNR